MNIIIYPFLDPPIPPVNSDPRLYTTCVIYRMLAATSGVSMSY